MGLVISAAATSQSQQVGRQLNLCLPSLVADEMTCNAFLLREDHTVALVVLHNGRGLIIDAVADTTRHRCDRYFRADQGSGQVGTTRAEMTQAVPE